MDGGERDQGDEGSGMSDSGGSPKRQAAGSQTNEEAVGPSGRARGGGRSGGTAGGTGGAGDDADPTADERVRRRREINRNSQKRIRERRTKEMDELRLEVRGWWSPICLKLLLQVLGEVGGEKEKAACMGKQRLCTCRCLGSGNSQYSGDVWQI